MTLCRGSIITILFHYGARAEEVRYLARNIAVSSSDGQFAVSAKACLQLQNTTRHRVQRRFLHGVVPLRESSNLSIIARVYIGSLNWRKCDRCVIIHPAEVLLLDALRLAEAIDVHPLFLNESLTVGLE